MKKIILTLSLTLIFVVYGSKANELFKEIINHEISAIQGTDPEFRKQLAEVHTANLDLKDAFVSSDAAKVKQNVEPVKKAVSRVNMKLLSGEDHKKWMNYLKEINSSLKQIEGSGNINEQRKYYSDLMKLYTKV
jgi:hypothetical protein